MFLWVFLNKNVYFDPKHLYLCIKIHYYVLYNKRYEIFDFLYVNIITCKRLKIVYTLNEFKDKEEIDMTDGPIKVNSEIGALKLCYISVLEELEI